MVVIYYGKMFYNIGPWSLIFLGYQFFHITGQEFLVKIVFCFFQPCRWQTSNSDGGIGEMKLAQGNHSHSDISAKLQWKINRLKIGFLSMHFADIQSATFFAQTFYLYDFCRYAHRQREQVSFQFFNESPLNMLNKTR